MASLTDAKTIIDKASMMLADASQTYWQKSELLGWLNDGQLEVATIVPNSNTSTVSKILIAGVKQTVPIDSIRIIEFVKNMGLTGSVPGQAIRQVERKIMDRYTPNWVTDTAANVVIHAMYDAEDNNGVFYVWPPQPATPSYIEIIYSQIPVTIADINVGTKITIADYYQNVLLNYVLYRAFARDSEGSGQFEKSQGHYKMFADALWVKYSLDNNATNDVAVKK